MTDAEISRRLALAIGWPSASFYQWYPEKRLLVEDANGWRRFFDYRDPAVIWPIAEKFNLFPQQTLTVGVWACRLLDNTLVNADTAAKAVALAVIAAKGGA